MKRFYKNYPIIWVDFNTCDDPGVVALEKPGTEESLKEHNLLFLDGANVYFSDNELIVFGTIKETSYYGKWGGVFNPENVINLSQKDDEFK